MRYRYFMWSSAGAALAIALAVVPAAQGGTIDFEGLSEGQVIDEVSNGAGASGLPPGHVDVFGFNPDVGFVDNAAIVFDSSCPPGGVPGDCSGEDVDLGTPNETCGAGGPGVGDGGECPGTFENDAALGNIAIIAENLVDQDGDDLIDDPDDADFRGQYLELDFNPLRRTRAVTVNSVTYVDNDEGEFDAQIEFFGPGTLDPSTVAITPVGDNGVNTLTPGIQGVTRMRVTLNGSGAVDNIVIQDELVRDCWVTTGGFDKGEVQREDASGVKICTFGGNVGPAPSGALEVNWHDGPLAGAQFHTNDIDAVDCEDRSRTGPGQPGRNRGLTEDTLLFECNGRFNHETGYTCTGFLLDGGEPAGRRGNDPDQVQVIVRNAGGTEVARCEGILSGGNVQIHPPVGPPTASVGLRAR